MEEKKSFKQNLLEYLELYWVMFKIGICTFGGGYAMVSIIYKELGEKKKWIDEDTLLDYIAISQITPGIVAINISTFVGNKRKGIIGGIVSTLAVVTPSLIIITIIAAVLSNFYENEYVQHAFAGIRICVCVLIVNATVGFLKKSVIDVLTLIVFLCVFVVAAFTSIQTIYIVLVVIALSVIITVIKGCIKKKPDNPGSENKEDK